MPEGINVVNEQGTTPQFVLEKTGVVRAEHCTCVEVAELSALLDLSLRVVGLVVVRRWTCRCALLDLSLRVVGLVVDLG